jgi:hypothetical protein
MLPVGLLRPAGVQQAYAIRKRGNLLTLPSHACPSLQVLPL